MENKKMKRPNIIFMVIDTLRARNLGCYGYSRNTSPNIDAIAQKGIIFEKNFSTNNTTDNSHLSILSGRHILKGLTLGEHALDGLFYTPEELSSFFDSGGTFLQEILQKNGYKTYCLKILHGWQKRGFDHYFKELMNGKKDKPPLLRNFLRGYKRIFKPLQKLYYLYHKKNIYLNVIRIKKKLKGITDTRPTDEAIKIIKNNKGKENFFMWIDYKEAHKPYNPGKFMGTFKDHSNMMEWITARYDEGILYDDYLISKVIETLKEENLFDNTILFIMSDHGESLGEHGINFCHHSSYDVSFHTPLIIHGKNLPKKRINTLTQLEDLPPTVLDLIGIKYEESLFDGKSLMPLIEGKIQKIRDSVFMEEYLFERKRTIRTEKFKYIEATSKKDAVCIACNKIHGGVTELYDLEKDPGENTNLVEKDLKTANKMKTKLHEEIKKQKTRTEKRKLKNLLSNL